MRSDLARAVNLPANQRPGLDDYKISSSGSYTGVTRQPSAGRKPPQQKVVLPEFPRRPAAGSGSSSYAALGAAGRSTSVPRPSSRTSATQIAAGSVGGASNAAATVSTSGGVVPASAAPHTSPRGATRPPAASPSSILESLTTPSVLPGGTRASLAQRMNSSSVLDYGMLAGGSSSSAVRIKRHGGDPATGASPGATSTAQPQQQQPQQPPHYSSLSHPADHLRAIHLSGPAPGASGPSAAAGAAGSGRGSSSGGVVVSGAVRRASTERSAVERIVSRNSSFSSQSGSYSAGQGRPASPGGAGTGPVTTAVVAPGPPPGAPSSSYHSAVDQPSRLAGGAIYASQYAHQYGGQPTTLYIPHFSQHSSSGSANSAIYGAGSGASQQVGGGAVGGPHYGQQMRPAALSVSTAAPLPPVVLSPSAAGTMPSSSQLYPPTSAVSAAAVAMHEYAARPVQRTGSVSLSRPVVGGANAVGTVSSGGGASAAVAAGRLRALSLAADDDTGSVDGGSNSSLRRVQMHDEQPRLSGSGLPVPPVGGPPPVSSPKPAGSVTGSGFTADALPSPPRSQQHSLPQQQQSQQPPPPQPHIQHPLPHPSLHPNLHAATTYGGPMGALPMGASLDGGGNSYSSTASNASSASTNTSNKSSVAAAGTGISSATTSRTGSTISQRSAADALAHVGGAAGAPAAASAAAAPSRHGHAPAPKAPSASLTDSSERSSAEGLGRAQSGPSRGSGSAGNVLGGPDRLDLAGPVCGPLPDLPLMVAPRDAGPGRGCVGLQNLGNTCFMNSILQSLNAVPELMQQFLNPPERPWSSKAVVAPAYSGLVRDMMNGSPGGCVNPSAFLRKVSKHDSRWGDGRQQDSQEFLNSLLEALQTECNRITCKPVYRELQGKGSEEAQAEEAFTYARSWNDSIVDDIFGGLTQSTIQCHACKRVSHTFEPFLGLAVPIPSNSGSTTDTDRDRDGPVSVADCLRAFVECEELRGDDSYKCESCKRRQPHSKRMQIFRPPRVLVLTLKRFAARPAAPGFFSRFRSPAKNNTPVRLEPDPLDLTPYCNPLGLRGLSVCGRGRVAPLYQLVAVSHHSGSLEGGHYTAQARSCLDGHWYNFNDSCVRREASRPSGSSSSAYVLFYRLADLPPSASQVTSSL